ncbi:argininosuccinate lyase [Ruminococcaceae bacterium OttesenSCG-928-D13]|nr:argininosuccinate lyase [Ruminococcaceae bacterium OttesenSCG-928-D13]
MKMWAGRFEKELDAGINDFNSSISFDWVMYKQDIEGSLAHAAMLGAQGIISAADAAAIEQGLLGILADLESGALEIDPAAEDIHMFVEAELTSRIGDAGKRLHTARSRNDQVATDLCLYLRTKIAELTKETRGLAAALVGLAEGNLNTVMPGYTHLQVAQPVTFAHHLMAWAQMLRRDLGRLEDCAKRMNQSPLGAGALAGTSYPIDRRATADALGFTAPCPNSMDAVSDRDFCVELASAAALLMTHLSRFSEEIILWCSAEFRFIELDDAFATGSSIMPQKKNPDITELVRGKAGRVTGDLVTLLTMLKGLPLAYNKDLQEDKQAVFDAVETALACLRAFTPMVNTMTVLSQNMRNAAAKGFINATDCADYLTKKGMPFRDAYKITGALVARCVKENTTLEALPLAAYKEASPLFEEDIYHAIDLDTCVAGRASEGGPAPQAVKRQIAEYKAALGL